MKGKFVLLSFLVLGTIFFINGAFANSVGLTTSNKEMTIYTGEVGTVYLTVSNNQDFRDRISVSVFPQYIEGITTSLEGYSIDLNAYSNKTLYLVFNVPDCAEEAKISFTVTVVSSTNNDMMDSKAVIINTERKNPVCISDVKLDTYVMSPGSLVRIGAYVTNPSVESSLPVYVQISVVKDNEILQRFDEKIETIDAKKTEEIDKVYQISKYASPGFYKIEVGLKDYLNRIVSTKSVEFRISEISNITTEKTMKWGIFAQTILINAKNEGNVPSSDFYVSESIPSFATPFFFPQIEPDVKENVDNRVVYKWLVVSLAPGQEKTITYSVSIWNALLIIFGLGVVTYYVFMQTFAVSINKKHSYSGPLTKEREISIFLEIKNHSRHEIKEILVRDFVPGVATVVERFDTLRPTLRKVTGGTELIWTLDSLRPGEERVVNYRIRPVVNIIGTLKLPMAYIKYLDKKKEVNKVLSKGAYIKASV